MSAPVGRLFPTGAQKEMKMLRAQLSDERDVKDRLFARVQKLQAHQPDAGAQDALNLEGASPKNKTTASSLT